MVDISKNITCPDMFHILPDWSKNLLNFLVGYEALPEEVVLVDVILKMIVGNSAIVSLRVTGKQFIAPCASQSDFYKFRSQFGHIPVGIALANTWFLKVVSKVW